jgi:hypothetical protein
MLTHVHKCINAFVWVVAEHIHGAYLDRVGIGCGLGNYWHLSWKDYAVGSCMHCWHASHCIPCAEGSIVHIVICMQESAGVTLYV